MTIEEGRRVVLARVEYKGLDEEVKDDFIKNTEYQNIEYQRSRFEEIKNILQEEHQNIGYYDVSVDYELQPLISGEYVLTFIIDKEEIITVRNILYFGNVYTNDEAIKKELTFEAGDILEQKSIDVSRSNLYDLDLFQTLSINVDGQDAQRDIIVQMAEQRRKYASLGGGISTDAGLRLTGRTGHRNLLAKHITYMPSDRLVWLGMETLGTSIKIAQYGVPSFDIQHHTSPFPILPIWKPCCENGFKRLDIEVSSSSAALGLQLYLLTFFSFCGNIVLNK